MGHQLVVVKGRSAAQALKLPSDGSVTTVGRQEGCQLRIVSSQVSRRHCELFEEAGQLYVQDLNSSNGTFVDGQRIQGRVELRAGQQLTIGNIAFRVEAADTPPAPAPAIPGRAADTAVAHAVAAAQDEELDFEVEADDVTTIRQAPSRPAQPAAAPADDEPIELGEDDVADFLLDLDDDSPKR